MQSLSRCVWLTPLSTISSRFLRSAANGRIFCFSVAEYYCPVCTHHIFFTEQLSAGKLRPAGWLVMFANKVLLAHGHLHLFTKICSCLCASVAESSGCTRNQKADKASNV